MTSEREANLGYSGIGATRDGVVPEGFRGLSRSTVVGRGEVPFEAVSAALLRWDIHRGAGLVVESTGPVAPGARVTLFLPGPGRSLPLTIACEVVYVIDEPGRRGFGYGTLPGHPEEGEARFLVESDPARPDSPVTFSVDGFSRPGRPWAASLGPLLRLAQEAATQGYLRAARRAAAPPDRP